MLKLQEPRLPTQIFQSKARTSSFSICSVACSRKPSLSRWAQFPFTEITCAAIGAGRDDRGGELGAGCGAGAGAEAPGGTAGAERDCGGTGCTGGAGSVDGTDGVGGGGGAELRGELQAPSTIAHDKAKAVAQICRFNKVLIFHTVSNIKC